MMAVTQRSYYDAAEQGRRDRMLEQTNMLNNQIRQQEVDQGNRLNALYQDPQATPEQYARAGATGVAQTLQALLPDNAAHVKEFATQMMNAAKYAQGVPQGQTKAFIERNFPQLAQAYGPDWATANDDQVRAEMNGMAARFGVQAGVGPDKPAGESGAMYQYVTDNGTPAFGTARDVRGKRPYRAPQEDGKPPAGYRVKADGSYEPVPGGPADPNVGKGKITDTERLAAAYATRMRKSADLIQQMNYTPTTKDMVLFNKLVGDPGMMQSAANSMLSSGAKQYFQALQDFSRAKLRKESGAVISKEEIAGDLATFFPLPGDDAATIEQKRQARETAIEGMIGAAGGAYKAPQNTQRAPAEAEAYLKAHPELAPQFKAKYGYLP